MVVLSDSYVKQTIEKLKNCNSLGRFTSEAEKLLLSHNLYDEKDRNRLISYIKEEKQENLLRKKRNSKK